MGDRPGHTSDPNYHHGDLNHLPRSGSLVRAGRSDCPDPVGLMRGVAPGKGRVRLSSRHRCGLVRSVPEVGDDAGRGVR
jgi:hypothetical protein